MTTARVLESIRVPQPASRIPPPQAAAVGYNSLTWDTVVFGSNTGPWYSFNLLSKTPTGSEGVNQANGSMYISGIAGDQFGASVCSAYSTGVGSNWKGKVFSGGFYVEVALSIPGTVSGTPGQLPFPAVWCDDIDFLTQNSANLQWPGQATGYLHWIEYDFFQWAQDTDLYWGAADIIDWIGNPATSYAQPTNSETHLGSATFPNENSYGSLWVPATPSSNGYKLDFLNNVRLLPAAGTPAVTTWAYWNPSSPFTPAQCISGAPYQGSFIDQCHFALIMGTSTLNPMTVYSLRVWQASEANNIVQ
jgi:hypothetical protein